MEPILNDTNVRFWCPELTQEGQWRHVTLVFNRAGIMKNSSVSLYVDGQHVSTQKVRPSLYWIRKINSNGVVYSIVVNYSTVVNDWFDRLLATLSVSKSGRRRYCASISSNVSFCIHRIASATQAIVETSVETGTGTSL